MNKKSGCEKNFFIIFFVTLVGFNFLKKREMKAIFVNSNDIAYRDVKKEKKHKRTDVDIIGVKDGMIKSILGKLEKGVKYSVIVVCDGKDTVLDNTAANKVRNATYMEGFDVEVVLMPLSNLTGKSVVLDLKAKAFTFKPVTNDDVEMSISSFVSSPENKEFFENLGLE